MTKIPHLSYIGDAEIGEDSNIAAANVTANFSHRGSRRRGRGSGATSGPGSTIRSWLPSTSRDDAWIAPGSVITDDVPPGSLAGFAPRQETKEGWVHEKHGKPDRDS